VKKKTIKKPYRVRNWSDYNRSLIKRGSLTVWIDDDAAKSWLDHSRTGRRGAPRIYSDAAIQTILILKSVYHLPLRAAQGFGQSIFEMMSIGLPIPDYTTTWRRSRSLEVFKRKRKAEESLHLVIDSSGLKVFGEGEWKTRQHGYSKRRTWRKLHLGIDESTGEIVTAVMTGNDVSDGEVIGDLLDQVDGEITQVSADGAYDHRDCYKAIRNRGATAVIPPRSGARIWQHGNNKGERLCRDQNLRRCRKVGRAKWKRESGYHRRSKAENAFFRYKTIIGSSLKARKFTNQATEAFIGCLILNKMMGMGAADSYVVA
jgi:IS5 family transposase